ncbi:MAG: T9SS type A sorting domain-containing protein, partial [Ignavibacteriaceae bacterium]|nr:T9SS type A sorting domain-containing protein [Ignavibacteriaceae bacterium]
GVPVELVSFNASVNENSVTLSWITATELNNSGFEVERSGEVEDWERIGFVSGNGTTTEINYYSYTDENLLAGSYVYRLKQVDLDGTYEYSKIISVDIITSIEFELSQNYPNPFNPSTSIKFSIPEGSQVSLRIYNSLGQEIKELVNRFMEAGIHTVNFNAVGLNSGMYFYKLNAGEFNQVRKMTLIK